MDDAGFEKSIGLPICNLNHQLLIQNISLNVDGIEM